MKKTLVCLLLGGLLTGVANAKTTTSGYRINNALLWENKANNVPHWAKYLTDTVLLGTPEFILLKSIDDKKGYQVNVSDSHFSFIHAEFRTLGTSGFALQKEEELNKKEIEEKEAQVMAKDEVDIASYQARLEDQMKRAVENEKTTYIEGGTTKKNVSSSNYNGEVTSNQELEVNDTDSTIAQINSNGTTYPEDVVHNITDDKENDLNQDEYHTDDELVETFEEDM